MVLRRELNGTSKFCCWGKQIPLFFLRASHQIIKMGLMLYLFFQSADQDFPGKPNRSGSAMDQ